MNKRMRIKKNKINVSNNISAVLDVLAEKFTVIEDECVDTVYNDDIADNTSQLFRVLEIPDMVFKINVKKKSNILLGEHISYDFDLNEESSTMMVIISGTDDDNEKILNVMDEYKSIYDKCGLLVEDGLTKNDLFKAKFDEIKEKRMSIKESKKSLFEMVDSIKRENDDVRDTFVKCVQAGNRDVASTYEVSVSMKEDAVQERIEFIYNKLVDDSLLRILDEKQTQYRVASVFRDRESVKRKF